MADHNQTGKEGEEAAAAYLESQGYAIRHRNWRSGRNELDLVAEKDGWMVVVEVKTRRDLLHEAPWQAVTPLKIRRTVTAAHHYLRRYAIDLPVRFDILSITPGPEGWQIDHIEDAFTPPLL